MGAMAHEILRVAVPSCVPHPDPQRDLRRPYCSDCDEIEKDFGWVPARRTTMCGIVGALSFTNSTFRVSEPYLIRMRDAMSHRGPDGAGILISSDRRLALGHRRLAIIDLSERAAQPMSNEDDTLWVVFNGEIYNHADIRTELERQGGHRWKTDHSDTEVILHAFEQWG